MPLQQVNNFQLLELGELVFWQVLGIHNAWSLPWDVVKWPVYKWKHVPFGHWLLLQYSRYVACCQSCLQTMNHTQKLNVA